MKHLTHDQLWELAAAPTPAEPHLDTCLTCLSALDDIKAAQSVLRLVPEPPVMPAAMAKRVELKLADVLEARQARRWTSWWPSMPRLAFAAVAVTVLAVGAWVLAKQTRVEPALIAERPELPIVTPVPALAPRTPKLTATVASAKRARNSTAALKSTQTLSEGSALTTEKGGALWLRLPDGSRAGLTGASEMQLAKLEAKALTLDLERGNLALVVPHRQDRVLTVRAGDLEVKDLGTQFLVSREMGRIVVAVEEGSVEVKVPGQTRTVTAGRAVSYQQGQLDELAWLPAVKPVSKPEPQAANDAQPTPEIAAAPSALLEEQTDKAPPPPEVDDPAAEWNAVPPTVNSPPVIDVQTQQYPPAVVVTVTPPAWFSLGEVERRMNDLRRQVASPFTQGGSLRQMKAKEIGRMADAGDNLNAIDAANDWLRYAHDPPEEQFVRREVLFQKMRCLRRLGRLPEADLVRRELEALSSR